MARGARQRIVPLSARVRAKILGHDRLTTTAIYLHVNPFGKYTLNLDRDSPTLDYALELRRDLAPAIATASVRPACEGNGPFCRESLPYPKTVRSS
jgi:hypothetical protein